jgi:hypothetical protein
MPEIITTVAQAPSNPTPPGPLVTGVPAAAPRDAVISDAAYNQLPLDQRDRFARVRQGPQGGSEWRDRSTLSDCAAASQVSHDRTYSQIRVACSA